MADDDIVDRLRRAEWLCRECGRNGDRTYTEEPPWWTTCCDLCDDRNDAAAEIERLRAFGDDLAVAYRHLGGLDVAHDPALRRWEEARRG